MNEKDYRAPGSGMRKEDSAFSQVPSDGSTSPQDTRPDDREYTPQQFVVAMLDIMGQTRALQAVGNPLDENCNRASIRERWRAAVVQVYQMQENFKRALSNISTRGRFAGLDSRLTWQAFGDSVVVSVPVADSDCKNFVCYAHGLILTCAAVLLGGLIGKAPLQGAIELGLATTDLFPDGQIYGPVLAEVHGLLKEARFPRVVVGKRLRRVLGDAAGRQITDAGDRAEVWAEQASDCLTVLAEAEGQCFVDYLGSGYAAAVGGLHGLQTDILAAFEWIKQQEMFSRRAGEVHIADKYTKLREYFESRGFTG